MRFSLILFTTFFLVPMSCFAQPNEERSLTVEDILNTAAMGKVSVSPNGEYVAVVIDQAFNQCPSSVTGRRPGYLEDAWWREACREIRLYGRNGYSFTISDDEVSFTRPVWSPSGEVLAVLSIGLDGLFQIWLWDENSGLRQFTSDGIDPEFNSIAGNRSPGSISSWGSYTSPFAWTSNTEVAYAERLVSRDSNVRSPVPHPATSLQAMWDQRGNEAESTVYVLTTEIKASQLPRNRIVLTDTQGTRRRVVAEGSFRAASFSPDGETAIVSELLRDVRPGENEVFSDLGRFRSQNAISSLASHTRTGVAYLNNNTLAWLDDVFDMNVSFTIESAPNGVGYQPAVPTPTWDETGNYIAFIGHSELSISAAPKLFVLDTEDGQVEQYDTGSGKVSGLDWISSTPVYSQILGRSVEEQSCLSDWCFVRDGAVKSFRPLSGRSIPIGAQTFNDGFVYLEDGDLWVFDFETMASQNVTRELEHSVISIEASSFDNEAISRFVRVRLAARLLHAYIFFDGRGTKLTLIDLEGFENLDIEFYDSLRIYSSGSPNSVLALVARAGSTIEFFTLNLRDTPKKQFRLNAHLSDIKPAKTQEVYFTDERGFERSGFVALPDKRVNGAGLPAILNVYPNAGGRSASAAASYNQRLSGRNWQNTHLFLSAGFAVAFVELPTEDPAFGGPLCEQLAAIVRPAVRELETINQIDVDRLGIFGHSYGAYSAASLMMCTDLFSAGVAVGGFYDLVSYPFSLKPRDMLNGHALGSLSGFAELEVTGHRLNRLFRFGATPWVDLDLYVENSPLFQLRSLSSPLMLVHGDFDSAPISQAEHMLIGARRLGKDVTLVTYGGEYHHIISPPNIEDFWRRTIAFFESHLH